MILRGRPVAHFQGPTDLPWAYLDLRYLIAGRASLGATDKELPGCVGGKSGLLPPLQIIAQLKRLIILYCRPVDTFQGPTDLAWAHEVTAKPLQSGQGKSGGA